VSPISSHASVVQEFPSPQRFGVPPVQDPALHASPTVQKSPSLQATPFSGTGSLKQLSPASSQAS
jgi:hypothetical protein